MNGAIVMLLLVDVLAIAMLIYFHYENKHQSHPL